MDDDGTELVKVLALLSEEEWKALIELSTDLELSTLDLIRASIVDKMRSCAKLRAGGYLGDLSLLWLNAINEEMREKGVNVHE